ncbi:FHA domain-containing protein [Polyangium aurulentum]|uniref:FHA domain-containing protein n=1 Tax=Polyangium aurulentum TaxID=2567896 RepID=UPI0010ADD0F1|nr:FHA domain-containing protein [Polyangium aurulentum]UQA59349.1 FHA domain-containing protein [Polyangium aurulentum]
MSLRIFHVAGRQSGATQVFTQAVVRFGRAADNHVVFDANHDREASGHHAEIRREGSAWVLVDLGSRNGTFVGARRIDKHALTPGDEVSFGAKGPKIRVEALDQEDPTVARDPAGESPRHAGESPRHAGESPRHVGESSGHAAASPGYAGSSSGHAGASPGYAGSSSGHAGASPGYAAAAPGGAYGSSSAQHVSPAVQHFSSAAAHASPGPAHVPPPFPHASSHQQHAPSAVVQAPPAGARVGQRTIAMMVSSAVAAAAGKVRPRRTMEINALVEQQVSAATAGQRRTAYALGGLLFVALAALGGLIFWSTRSQGDIQKLREDLAQLSPDDPRRKEIEGRLGSLHPSNASFGRNLYDRSKKGIFMLAAAGEGFCTAFAVKPNVLATTAACIHQARSRGNSVFALENEGRGQVKFEVSDLRMHPGYRHADPNSITPDVGVLTIKGRAAVVLEIAAKTELQASGAGDDVYLIGFPGRLMDATNPSATFLAAHVGRITGASGRPAAFPESWLVQHDAGTTRGTNGSPIFNGQGKVIGINAGGYVEEDQEKISGRKTEVVKDSPYKFGMRIDLVEALLR